MIRRNALVAVGCWLVIAQPAWGEAVVRRIDWQEVASADGLKSGTLVPRPDGAGAPSLRIVHEAGKAVTFPLVIIDQPGIRMARYALRGRVKYEGVAAGSYLEMWTHLPEGAFFSRTLADTGPMQRLEGSSSWRPFLLPFTNREGGPPPGKLVINLVLTGAGTVEFGPLELVQFAPGENPTAGSTGAWWGDRQAALAGAIAGSALGILGGLVGWLSAAGHAKTFVLTTLKAIGLLGAGAVLLGAAALAAGQPYAVYYPLLLGGLISAALGATLPRWLSRRYQDLELRRMRALDA